MRNQRRSLRKLRRRRLIVGGKMRVKRSKWKPFVQKKRRKPKQNQQRPHRTPPQQYRQLKLLPPQKASALPLPRNPRRHHGSGNQQTPEKARESPRIDAGPQLTPPLLPGPV